MEGSNEIEAIKIQYGKLSDDWRQINTIVWAVPAVAVSIMTGILIGAYDHLNGLPRIVSLSLGSLLLFALTVELVKKRILMNAISRSLQDLETKLDVMPFPYSTGGLIKRISNDKNNSDERDPVYRLFKWAFAREYLTIVTFIAAIALAVLSWWETVKSYSGHEPLNYLIGVIIVIVTSGVIALYRWHLRGEQRKTIKSNKPEKDYQVSVVATTKPNLSKGTKQTIKITVSSKKPEQQLISNVRINGEVVIKSDRDESHIKLEEDFTDQQGQLLYSWIVNNVGKYTVRVKVFEPNNPDPVIGCNEFTVCEKPSSLDTMDANAAGSVNRLTGALSRVQQ